MKKPKYDKSTTLTFILKAMKFTSDEISTMQFQDDFTPAIKKIEAKEKRDHRSKTVIEYFNWVCKKKFRGTAADITKINARFKEGFTIGDFKKVIHYKNEEWGKDLQMSKYLRPETLFGTKFEGYLQAAPEVPHGFSSKEEYKEAKNKETLEKCKEPVEPLSEEEEAELLRIRKEKLGF